MRIDRDRDAVYVVWRGRSYLAPISEVESAARVPGARVSFTLRRAGGEETVHRVRLRRGTRTNKRQRRFGDLVGARRPGSKVKTGVQEAYGIDVATQPFRVVATWLQALSDLDAGAAADLYLPSAVVHTAEGSVTGRNHIRAALEVSPWFGIDPSAADLRGADRAVQVEADGLTASMEIEAGHIVEQWLGVDRVGPPPDPAEDQPEVEVVTMGSVDEAVAADGVRRVLQLATGHGLETRYVRLKLSQETNPTIEQPARAQVTVDVDGTMIRAHATAPVMRDALDRVVARLKTKLDHRSDRERHRPVGRVAEVGEWRHGNLPSEHTVYFDRAREDREIVRHKSFAPGEMTVDEAAWDMALLDYEFFLFVELTTGRDAVLATSGDGVLSLQVLGGAVEPAGGWPDGIMVSGRALPHVRPSEAIDLLDASGERYLYFQNSISERGNVMYRRYDGHYGLITPPTAPDQEPGKARD
jgi:ribosome-associated translation inhibitor RaiA